MFPISHVCDIVSNGITILSFVSTKKVLFAGNDYYYNPNQNSWSRIVLTVIRPCVLIFKYFLKILFIYLKEGEIEREQGRCEEG